MNEVYCADCGRLLPAGSSRGCCTSRDGRREVAGVLPPAEWANWDDDIRLAVAVLAELGGVATERRLLGRLPWSGDRLKQLPVGIPRAPGAGHCAIWREGTRLFITDRAKACYRAHTAEERLGKDWSFAPLTPAEEAQRRR